MAADRPTSPHPFIPRTNFSSSPRHLQSPLTPTLRTLTGPELMPTSPISHSDKRHSRPNIFFIFRSADGEEQQLPTTHRPTSPSFDDAAPLGKPRISSVTDSAAGSPDRTRQTLDIKFDDDTTPHTSIPELEQATFEDDAGSTYSHASALNLDDLDDEDIAGLRDGTYTDLPSDSTPPPPVVNRQFLRQSFANSFAKAKQAQVSRKAVVLVRSELQPHNRASSLVERCVRAFGETLDMNLVFARAASERFASFSALFTKDERLVVGEFLKEAAMLAKNETPTPWRAPMQQWSETRPLLFGPPLGQGKSTHRLASILRGPWSRRNAKALSNDTLVRSVVFGTHVIPGVQSAESLLMRMAGEYQREEMNRKANRAERIDIPLSFAMTLSGTLATFARLECSATYKRYRSRSAANRRSNPQALIILKTRYDGLRLSFAVTLHGESPCTVLFRRPRIFSQRKIDDYATLVTEAKDILAEFGREVVGPRE